MSLRSLELDPIRLTSHARELKLRVSSVAQLSIPQSLAHLGDNDFLDVLSSGKIWLRRGAYCAFECQIFFDGLLLDTKDHRKALEVVGYDIRDATLWTQLFLSPAAQIFSNDDAAISETTFTIRLGQGKPPSDLADSPRAWLSGNIDIQPPDSVLCAQFEKLFIKLEFSTAKRRLPVAKNDERNTEDPTHTDSTDLMLLDPFQILIDSHQLEEFEAVVQYQSQQLSKSIAECFESLRSKFSPPDQMLFDIIPPLAAASPTMPPPPCHDNGHEGVEDSVQEVFPLVEVPTARGGSDLDMRESHFQESEMLLAAYSPVQETLLVESESHEEDMRLSQPISDIPSQISQSLTCSTVSTISQLMPESSIRNNTRGDLDLSILSQVSKISPLVKQGLHILIGGYGRCAHQETKDIQSRRPHPETSLSKIAPSIFSPGFRESMSHNAKFLPIISRAMSITLPRNVQSSMLRSNLLKLAQSDKSAIPNINDESLERGSVQRLAAVVQTRLWAMMQKWVYDTSAARKLAWGGIAEEGVLKIDGIEEGRHGGLCYPTSSKIECSTTVGLEVGIDKTGEEDRDDFEDLLAAEGTEEDLLAYFDESEIERLEIEHETDEMLLGAGWDYGGKEIDDGMLLLLGSSSEVDSMLL